MRASHRQEIGRLNQALQDEVRDRKAGEHEKDTRDAAEKSERDADSVQVHRELEKQKENFSINKEEHASCINNLTLDVEMVTSYLQKISSAWECLNGSKLLSSGRSGDDFNGFRSR